MSVKTLNKKALVDNIADKLNLTKKDATEFIDVFLDEIRDVLEDKGTVELSGFGKFEVRFRAERDGFNPKTKESIRIAASHSVAFKPAKALKDLVK
ncbi:MAG: HU family DNA-binding protein [Erysipelothrix sp.]|nr:HU family DNA-binding protein [Erysipelothrix sp.]